MITAKVLKCTARETHAYPSDAEESSYEYEIYRLPSGEIYVPEVNEDWIADDEYSTCHGSDRVETVEDTGRTVEIDETAIEAARTAYL